jgi:hypothetical protein
MSRSDVNDAGGGCSAPLITPEQFFFDLFSGTEYNVNLRAIDNSRKLPVKETFVRGAAEIIKWAEEHGTSYDCYFGVATRNGSGKKEAIRELVVVHVEVDFKNTPQAKADNLLAGFPLPPTYRVASCGGYHLEWIMGCNPSRK